VSAIFVSYRRADSQGHARALYDDLCERYPKTEVFFDLGSIEAGDTFPDLLRDAVGRCRVLLALIGPAWSEVRDAQGRRRLDDARDFVRQEIAHALALGKRVIPVVFDDTPIPPADRLPEPLRALAGQDVHTLRGKQYEYATQLQELVRLLGKVEGVPAASLRLAPKESAPAVVEPEKLPYLCDRSAQENAFVDALRLHLRAGPRRRPLVLVVPGPANEAHLPFVERLDHAIQKRAAVRFLHLPRALPPGAADLARQLHGQIAELLQDPDAPDDAALLRSVRAQRLGGFAAVATWRSSECADLAAAMAAFGDYWAAFPDADEQTLVLGILCIKYDVAPPRGWLGRLLPGKDPSDAARAAVAALRERKENRFALHVLPDLSCVRLPDLDGWARQAYPVVGALSENRLRQIVPHGECLPMDDVLDRLRDVVAPRGPVKLRRATP
jgi:hypothetical protein